MKAYQKKQGPQGDQEQSGKTRSINMHKMGLEEEGDRERGGCSLMARQLSTRMGIMVKEVYIL